MSAPTGSDASTDAGESTRQPLSEAANGETESEERDSLARHDSDGNDRSTDSLVDRALEWARHWRAWSIALFSLLVVSWAAFLQPQTSPKGYIPIFLGFAAFAVGYVYLDEETQIRFASS